MTKETATKKDVTTPLRMICQRETRLEQATSGARTSFRRLSWLCVPVKMARVLGRRSSLGEFCQCW